MPELSAMAGTPGSWWGAVIPCTYSVEVFDGKGTEILNTISSAVARMKETSVLTVDMK